MAHAYPNVEAAQYNSQREACKEDILPNQKTTSSNVQYHSLIGKLSPWGEDRNIGH
jgi:hypothetical protein